MRLTAGLRAGLAAVARDAAVGAPPQRTRVRAAHAARGGRAARGRCAARGRRAARGPGRAEAAALAASVAAEHRVLPRGGDSGRSGTWLRTVRVRVRVRVRVSARVRVRVAARVGARVRVRISGRTMGRCTGAAAPDGEVVGGVAPARQRHTLLQLPISREGLLAVSSCRYESSK